MSTKESHRALTTLLLAAFSTVGSIRPVAGQEAPKKNGLSVVLPDDKTSAAEEESPTATPPPSPPSDATPAASSDTAAPIEGFIGVELPDEASDSTAETPSVKEEPPPPPPDPFRQPGLATGPGTKDNAEQPFDWFTVSPQVGYAFFNENTIAVEGFKARISKRNGIVIKLHLDLGGDGLSFELTPLFALQAGSITPDAAGFSEMSNPTTARGFAAGSFQSVGGETAIMYRLNIKKMFFPHVGIGFHGSYLMSNDIMYGAQFYGRAPVGITIYPHRHVGIMAEIGFMYGSTGVRLKKAIDPIVATMPPELRTGLSSVDNPEEFETWYDENQENIDQWMFDSRDILPSGYNRSQLAEDVVTSQLSKTILFDQGFGLDIVIGIRFP